MCAVGWEWESYDRTGEAFDELPCRTMVPSSNAALERCQRFRFLCNFSTEARRILLPFG